MPYTVTIRIGPRVTRERVPSLADAIDVLELRLTTLGPDARRPAQRALAREYEPEAARATGDRDDAIAQIDPPLATHHGASGDECGGTEHELRLDPHPRR